MPDLFSQIADPEAGFLLLPFVALALLSVYAFGRSIRRRKAATAGGRQTVIDTTSGQSAAPATEARTPDRTSQIERLFAYLEGATRAAERAMAAHAAAAKHLDSAEYQLQRLFDEFPMLSAGRAQPTSQPSLAVVAPAPKAHALAA